MLSWFSKTFSLYLIKQKKKKKKDLPKHSVFNYYSWFSATGKFDSGLLFYTFIVVQFEIIHSPAR